MTNILINESREIRYMAYVPEECKREDWLYEEYWLRALNIYQSDLEKAKRESIEFDREEDCKKIIMAIFYSMAEQDNIPPGIYQVPVEKPEIVEIPMTERVKCGCPCHRHEGVKHVLECCDDGYIETPYLKKVARLKSSEPKPESQEDIIQAFFIEYNRLMQGGRPQHSVALKLLDKFSLTRKRG